MRNMNAFSAGRKQATPATTGHVRVVCLAVASLLLAGRFTRAQIYSVGARGETEPVTHASLRVDDPCIWVHPSQPELSTIIGTDKNSGESGGLRVYDLEGTQIQFLPDGAMNNVDVRYGFRLGTQAVDLVTTCERNQNVIAVYTVDPVTRALSNVAARAITAANDVYGSCMYRSRSTGKTYVILNAKNGMVEQWELFDAGGGRVDAVSVRTFDVGSQPEGCVADDELGFLYIGEEDVGIWKYGAEPGDGTARVLVDTTSAGGHIVADVEGLTLYYAQGGAGYLIASSQGEGSTGALVSSFAVYERQGTNAFVMNFKIPDSNGIDKVTMCDGVDVVNFGLGAAYPSGLFVAHDDANSPEGGENFKLVAWEDIANARATPLIVDSTRNPRDTNTPPQTVFHYVATNGLHLAPYTNLQQAATNVQAAVDAASDGDTVLVGPGVYRGRVTLEAKTITLASWLWTTGDTGYVARTVLDGGGQSYVIFIDSTVGAETTVAGLTIRNADDGVAPRAEFNLHTNRIIDCNDGVDYKGRSGGTCIGNVLELNGDDGLDLDDAVDIRIEDNIIRDNDDDGIEIRLHAYAGPTLQCVIRRNRISGNGEDGIQVIDYPDISDRVFFIDHNLFLSNAMAGVGCMSDGNTVENYEGASIPEPIFLRNNTFYGNTYGVTGGDNMVALNNLIAHTTATAMKNVDGGSLVSYSAFWKNGTDFNQCNTDAATLVTADPLLNARYHLTAGSPCIDAGTNQADIARDLNGNPVPIDGNGNGISTLDIGALEYVPSGNLTLTVDTAHGTATPPPGVHTHDYGVLLTNECDRFDGDGTTQYVCTGWAISGGHDTNGVSSGTGTRMVMVHTNDATLTWLWVTNYWLDTGAAANGSVSPRIGWVTAGSNVSVTAKPDAYYHFTSWTGTVVSASNPLPLRVDRPHVLQAGFSEDLAANRTPVWWLASYGWTNDFDQAATNDQDGDGMITSDEWLADTVPTNRNSVMAMAGMKRGEEGITIEWQGGVLANQYLDHATNLLTVDGRWRPVFTNPPPTPVRASFLHKGVTNGLLYYRIRVLRPGMKRPKR